MWSSGVAAETHVDVRALIPAKVVVAFLRCNNSSCFASHSVVLCVLLSICRLPRAFPRGSPFSLLLLEERALRMHCCRHIPVDLRHPAPKNCVHSSRTLGMAVGKIVCGGHQRQIMRVVWPMCHVDLRRVGNSWNPAIVWVRLALDVVYLNSCFGVEVPDLGGCCRQEVSIFVLHPVGNAHAIAVSVLMVGQSDPIRTIPNPRLLMDESHCSKF
mmetsp:Transcript_27437/g.56219  ORF Transcript_27437/g.56219 Transcript_27437/m.56219 type:complete len:214 (+) Transcript_27437:364-1005(+)